MKIKNMKITTTTMLNIASLALIFLFYGGAEISASGNLTATAVSNKSLLKNKCNVTAFINIKSGGLNVRDSASKDGGIIETIPFDKEGTLAHIIADSGDGSGWLQINKAETVRTQNVFSGKGWVFLRFIGDYYYRRKWKSKTLRIRQTFRSFNYNSRKHRGNAIRL